MAAEYLFWKFSIFLILAIGIFRDCNGYALFENAGNETVATVCDTLVADHSMASNQSVQEPFPVTLHIGSPIYTPGTTKKITVSLRHAIINSDTQRTLKGFIIQARVASQFFTSNVGVGTWLPGDNEMVLQCGEGSSAIVQRNGTVGRDLPITLVYNAPATDVGPIVFLASWVEHLTTYKEERIVSSIIVAGGACEGSPCYNSGSCILDETDSRGHICECQIGFTGPNCEEFVCKADTCSINKICRLDIDDEDPNELYLCVCTRPTYTGENCDMSPCTSDPCLNGGTCYDTNSITTPFYCACARHYSGPRCEVAGPCANNPCNNGTCLLDSTNELGFSCDCSLIPFVGSFCNIDACSANPSLLGCKNGGSCYLSNGFPNCACATGFTSDDCSMHLCDLDPGPCGKINRQCLHTSVDSGFYCNCTILFTNPPACDVPTGIPTSCTPDNPCLNGGACTDVIPTDPSPLPFECTCTVEFKGTLCEQTKTRCEIAGFPCVNGGICNNNESKPICTCLPGYNNTFCQDDILPPEIICVNKTVTERGLYQYDVTVISDYGIEVNGDGSYFTVWDPLPPVVVPVGAMRMSVTAYDFSGNSAECIFYIILPDTIPPDLTCPQNAIFTTMPGEGATLIQLPPAVSVDNYSNVTMSANLNDTEAIPQGVHEVVVTSVDNDGNANNCTFWIRVEEPQVLYVRFSVDEQFVDTYANTSHPHFMEFAARVDDAMLTEMNATTFRDAFAGIMINSLSAGSIQVDSAILLNSIVNLSDADVVTNFTNAMNASFNDDGMMGNMSIVPGSLVVSENVCLLSFCLNGGVCLGGTVNNVTCNCSNTGYTGQLCDQKIDYCLTNVCENGGTCVSELLTSRCDCTVDFTGDTCNVTVDHCVALPCENGGTCTSGTNGTFTCECTVDYEGSLCQTLVDHCSSSPCLNGGNCTSGSQGSYSCDCNVDFTGNNCSIEVDHCAGNPCLNDGVCSSGPGGVFSCACFAAFTGDTCQIEVDVCADAPCQNGGTCNPTTNGFTCTCTGDFTGFMCEEIVDHCTQSQPCINGGTCTLNEGGGFTCACTVDFSGDTCQTQVDHCADQPCQNNGTCFTLTGGIFNCECTSDFTGLTCAETVDPCTSNPCMNSGACNSFGTAYNCTCTSGFEGLMCQTPVIPCDPNPCQNNGRCSPAENGFSCSCQDPGIIGDTCEIDLCSPNPCQNDGTCQRAQGSFSCDCAAGFMGNLCNATDNCNPNPCMNSGMCTPLGDSYQCNCSGTGFTGTDCETIVDLCNPNPCLNGGICGGTSLAISCTCPDGFVGDTCQTSVITPCDPSPCQNGGACDITAGSAYECNCTSGWGGQNCDVVITPCDQSPCQNGGACEIIDGSTYECNCTSGWGGQNCDVDLLPCSQSPCQNNGTCLELPQPGSYNCTCDAANWGGTHCEIDLTPCSPNPCYNEGNCTEGTEPESFICSCNETQWNGTLCEIDLTPCSPNPCYNEGNCTEGTEPESFICSCNETQWNGTLCEIDLTPCDPLPCLNGGNCTNEGPGLYSCQCDEIEWSGPDCDLDLTPCDPLPCLNNGSCSTLGAANFSCNCTTKWSGQLCEVDLLPCDSSPCENGGICQNGTGPGTFLCSCSGDFIGVTCGTLSNTCRQNPCQNGGICTPSVNGRICQCAAEYEGATCSTLKDPVNECASEPCLNGGTCINLVGNYACTCPDAFNGTNCESNAVNNAPLGGTTSSSWWIIIICLCFLIIIGIAAACVCVSMSKKASS
ncbi:uncharacterized protein [Apostichopus japonicus]|uniref:uncharacterized protein isoform X4 n=1 Tax=Stichopus japonicus TaxID=307972 RepID=UPI003AB82CAF